MAHILVIDDDVNLLQMVRLMLERVGHEVETARAGEKGIEMAGQLQPELAIIDVMMPELSGYDVVRRMREDPRTARIPIVILTARSQPMDKHMALEAGANSFLSKPVSSQELTDRVAAVLQAGVDYRVHTGLLTEPVPARVSQPAAATPTGSPPPTDIQAPPSTAEIIAATQPTSEIKPRPPRTTGRMPIGAEDIDQHADIPPTRLPVITVLSLRGGSGCTTIAINLAFLWASMARRVCVAELSRAGGHIPMHIHLTSKNHWGLLLDQGDIPDPRVLHQILLQHTASGVTVLAAPSVPPADGLTTPATQNILRELTSTYNPVVVDAGSLSAATVGALNVSSAVVVVMTDDPFSVQTTGQTLITLQNMGVEASRVRVVLNHTHSTRDLPPAAIQKALKRPLSAELPYDPNQPGAVRRGMPLVVASPKSPYAAAVQQLTRTITI
jgi:CheY-like chemotaxis protein